MVSGSDRDYDLGRNPTLYRSLQSLGVTMFAQDGSGIGEDVERLVTSGAIEESNPEVTKARLLSIPVIARQLFLRDIFEGKVGVAVAGTSGKTTTSGLLAFLLHESGFSPTALLGGEIINYAKDGALGNALAGKSDIMVIELDESRAEMEGFRPRVGLLLNISKDHKTLEELETIFRNYLESCDTIIGPWGLPLLDEQKGRKKVVTFGLDERAEIHPTGLAENEEGSVFHVGGVSTALQIPGLHNVENALGALAAATELGANLATLSRALPRFKGMKRRFELIAEIAGVRIIDDFGHNPSKIAASLAAAKPRAGRILAVYQPHGYGPTRFLRRELAETFACEIRSCDRLYILNIFDMGGTADRSISSADLVDDIRKLGGAAEHVPEKDALVRLVAREASEGDMILVMGARDPGLTSLCLDIASSLERRERSAPGGIGRPA
jgi:UDP-N-acetylmuramate--alanine ligase